MHQLNRLTSSWYQAMYQCYSDIVTQTMIFYQQKPNYFASALPITTNSISSPMGLGSDSVPVAIQLFNHTTYLADSMQFLLEYSLRFKGQGAYYIMPTFRGETPDKRHLNQFYHSECEITGTLSDVMSLCEDYIKHLASHIIKQSYYQQLVKQETIAKIEAIINISTFPQVTFEQAKSLLLKHDIKGINKIDDIETINSIGEQWLIHHFGGVVWLTHPLHKSVPFYQAYATNKQYARSADLLLGIGETIGCGQRADYQEVLQSLDDHQVALQNYQWYIDMKCYYPMQTSGFGLGIERFIAWLFDIDDIRRIPYVSREKDRITYP